VAGAVLAIPVAGAIQVIVQHLWIDPALATLSPEQKETAVKGTDENGDEELGLPEPEVLLEDIPGEEGKTTDVHAKDAFAARGRL
jgi:hypothetical protein